jgi:predicted DsbA family dithiol-disulfide isomerase
MNVEIFSDILCPWCYMGKRRLAAALAEFPHGDQVGLVWRSYQLSPGEGLVPGVTAVEAMAQWMDPSRVPARVALIKAEGRADGLTLNLDGARPVNTFDAHRLTHLAAERGPVADLIERMFRAYHTDNLNVADHDVLVGLAGDAGLPPHDVRAVLSGDAYADAVTADGHRAKALGIRGVPSVVINGGRPFPGVQSVAALRTLVEQAWVSV